MFLLNVLFILLFLSQFFVIETSVNIYGCSIRVPDDFFDNTDTGIKMDDVYVNNLRRRAFSQCKDTGYLKKNPTHTLYTRAKMFSFVRYWTQKSKIIVRRGIPNCQGEKLT